MFTTLLEQDIEIVGVITYKDRGINSDYANLKPICDEHRIPLLFTKDVNAPDTIGWIKSHSPDVVFCMGWPRLIKRELLQLPPMGIVGYHPAALPRNRGRHPLIWALVLGLKRTASTFFFMDEGADSGDLLNQKPITISEEDDAGTLYAKIVEAAKEQMAEIISSLSSGNYKREPQDYSLANLWRKRGMQDGAIDWRMSANSIYNLVRGLTKPYVGAHISIGAHIHKVWKCRKYDCGNCDNIEFGKVLDVTDDGNIIVKCGEGAIELLSVEPPILTQKGEYI